MNLTSLVRLLPVFILILVAVSCDKTCRGVDCENGGTCDNGACACPEGYIGDFCEAVDNPCDTLECLNASDCVAGVCSCPEGYEGFWCEAHETDKFIGGFTVYENCDNAPYTYSCNVVYGDTTFQVVFSGLSGSFFPISGTILDSSITIPTQSFGSSNHISGQGQANDEGFVLNYILFNESDTLDCWATFID